MEVPAEELRAFQHLLQVYALEAGIEAAQLLLRSITEEPPPAEQPAPMLRHAASLFSSTSEIRRNWADFSDEESDG